MITTEDIQNLRQQTGVGIMEAKRALTETNGDIAAAIDNLRKAGQKLAATKSTRTTANGLIGSYVHSTGRVASLVAVACETDFVALTDDFKSLVHELAMHVAAANPKYLKPEDIPADVVAAEDAIYRDQLKNEGKPEAMWEKIVAGKREKWYAELCLLRQPYIKDDSLTISDLVAATVAKLGENIQITGFSRLSV